MEQQIIKIELGDGKKIVAEPNWDSDYKELCVWLEDKDGNMIQDLAIVGEDYDYGNSDEPNVVNVIPKHDNYFICVYGDEYDENYTNKFKVKAYKGEN